MRCCCGLATRNHPSDTQGGSINVSIRKRRPAIGTPPTGARRRASRRPPAYPAAISTIHYATPQPVRLNEDTPVLRHPYVASSKSTGLATRFPLATPPPRTPEPSVRHAPSNSANRPQSLVAHGSARGGPAFAYARSQDIVTAALNGEQQVHSRRRSETESPIQSIELKKGIERNADQQHAHIAHTGQHPARRRPVRVT